MPILDDKEKTMISKKGILAEVAYRKNELLTILQDRQNAIQKEESWKAMNEAFPENIAEFDRLQTEIQSQGNLASMINLIDTLIQNDETHKHSEYKYNYDYYKFKNYAERIMHREMNFAHLINMKPSAYIDKCAERQDWQENDAAYETIDKEYTKLYNILSGLKSAKECVKYIKAEEIDIPGLTKLINNNTVTSTAIAVHVDKTVFNLDISKVGVTHE